MLAGVEYALLRRFCRREKVAAGQDYERTTYSKLDRHFTSAWRNIVENRTVLDFGCGSGGEVVEIASAGARKVYGLEISDRNLMAAHNRLSAFPLADRCSISPTPPGEPVDCIFCVDCFEHFADPARVLTQMYSLLNPNGAVYISFGPTWYHPLGGHAFDAFPWAHLLICEAALVKWRNDYFPGESVGINSSGLNRMTVRRFFALCAESSFKIERHEVVPIRRLAWIHNSITREFTTSVVRAVLRRPTNEPGIAATC